MCRRDSIFGACCAAQEHHETHLAGCDCGDAQASLGRETTSGRQQDGSSSSEYNSPCFQNPNVRRSMSLAYHSERILKDWIPRSTASAKCSVQVLDLFSGCGGMSLGFDAVGQATGVFSLLGGIDINPVSLATYGNNLGVPGVQRDIRTLSTNRRALVSLLRGLCNYTPSKPLVLIGCAPCQGFSAHQKTHLHRRADIRNGLIETFSAIAETLQPDCVLMENVPELLTGRYSSHHRSFVTRMEASGYSVKSEVHNAAMHGVAQNRRRALVLAMRHANFELPAGGTSAPRTVRSAIGSLRPVLAGVADHLDTMHKSATHRSSTLAVIRAVPKDGGSRPRGIGPKCLDKVKGFSDVYGRLRWDEPSITITHYARNPASGRFVHPEQDRGLTMREAARLQGFPDQFQFSGGLDDVFRQIGEAVPPPMAVALALSIAKNLGVARTAMIAAVSNTDGSRGSAQRDALRAGHR